MRTSSYVFVLLAAAVTLTGCKNTTKTIDESTAEAAPTDQKRGADEMLAVGDTAPDFSVPDEKGNTIKLSDFEGKQNVVLIFYPGDDTPGCTRQLCAARDSWDAYKAANVQVIGVNPGSADSHKSFIDKHGFPFPILVDSEREVIAAYGTKGLLWTTRTVYGIDKDGKIVFAERGMPETEKILAAF